jgi:Ca2+-binding EF-hand superfamily protein
MFDRDGSGEISTDEFRDILKRHVMLEFDETTMAGVMSHFDPDGTGGIDFNEFCTLVMGESRNGPFGTGATADISPPPMISAGGDVIKGLREKMLVLGGQSATPGGKATQLLKLLKLQDADGSGHVSASVLKRSLARAGAPLSEDEFSALASVIVERGDGTVDYAKLTEALRTGNSAVYSASLNRGAPAGSQSGKQGTSLQGAGKKEREALWAAAAVEAARSPSRQSSQHRQNHGAAIVADLEAIASLPRTLVMTPSKATGRRGSNASRSSRQQSDSGGHPPATAGSNRGSSRRGSYR